MVGRGNGSGGTDAGGSAALESGPKDLRVDKLGTLGLREHQPDNREGLDGVPPGDVVEDNAREALEEGEKTKDNPVGEPLDVILRLGALKGPEREVGGDEEAKHVGQEAGEAVIV